MNCVPVWSMSSPKRGSWAISCSVRRSLLARARRAGHGAEAELDLLTVHGILHLLGYDHAEPDEHKEMFGLQDELLAAWRTQPVS